MCSEENPVTSLRLRPARAGPRGEWPVSWGLLGLSMLLFWGCAPGKSIAQDVLNRFVMAVQSEDLDALYCMLAGASQPDEVGADPELQRANFDAWARSRYEAYLTERDNGGEGFDEAGIVLVKTFALGKGTYYSVDSVGYGRGSTLGVDSTVRFGYGQVYYSSLSPGTTFYLAGAPAGRILAIRVPHRPGEVSAEVLETVQVRWELAKVPATASCPGGWAVVSVKPVPGSETTSLVTWLF